VIIFCCMLGGLPFWIILIAPLGSGYHSMDYYCLMVQLVSLVLDSMETVVAEGVHR
jgi:hypothetical protein